MWPHVFDLAVSCQHGQEETTNGVLKVAAWIQENSSTILQYILFFLLVLQPLASKIKDVDSFSVEAICPLATPVTLNCTRT